MQERHGYGRRCFRMFKFRSMVRNASDLDSHNEEREAAPRIENDPRVTPLGRFLRRTLLDELPELWNVLLGDMSLVGPRPMSLGDVSLFGEAQLMRRFSVKPGLTCLWQINGRSDLSREDAVRLDLRYVENWTLALDLQILWKTCAAVAKGRGAY